MALILRRDEIFPELSLPDAAEIIARGTERGEKAGFRPSAFLRETGFRSEREYKQAAMAERRVMLHAQIGYRDLEKSRKAWAEVHAAVAKAGGTLDRYGICLDWSMGYPSDERAGRPQGTGLILNDEEEWRNLTDSGPVAPHFGDFVLGMPAAVENSLLALAAGATSIGNLGQYFTFHLPGWRNDIATTEATLEALALLAARPEGILIHSNLDDGFAAIFCDLASALGAAMLERYIVEDLLGGRIAHCYGHSFSDPLTRFAFQRALAREARNPGTMIYGNTVAYRGAGETNYAAMATYLTIDALGQTLQPSGHALNPVPITEAERIPDIEEIIAAQLFALRLLEPTPTLQRLISLEEADLLTNKIITGAEQFYRNVIAGLQKAGIDTENAFELLLSLRRIGAKQLEELFGPGEPSDTEPRGRCALVKASTISELESRAREAAAQLNRDERDALTLAAPKICIGSSDVHEYGKMMVENLCHILDIAVIDAGVHAEPADFAETARRNEADAIVISTYNGIALDYFEKLQSELAAKDSKIPILIGGRLNQIPKDSNSSLPRDVTGDLEALGAIPCPDLVHFARRLAEIAMNGAS